MEADLQEFYGLDLAAAVYGKGGEPMSARRLLSLTLNLPHRSRTMRALDPESWPMEETLLGLAVERLDSLAAITVKAHGGRAKAPPEIVPRPKRRRRASKPLDTASMLAGLDKALAGGAA